MRQELKTVTDRSSKKLVFRCDPPEIKKLKQKIEELEFIKNFQQMVIAEAEIDTGNDYAKKSLPESLAKEVELKKKAILKSNGSANASGSQGKRSTKK